MSDKITPLLVIDKAINHCSAINGFHHFADENHGSLATDQVASCRIASCRL